MSKAQRPKRGRSSVLSTIHHESGKASMRIPTTIKRNHLFRTFVRPFFAGISEEKWKVQTVKQINHEFKMLVALLWEYTISDEKLKNQTVEFLRFSLKDKLHICHMNHRISLLYRSSVIDFQFIFKELFSFVTVIWPFFNLQLQEVTIQQSNSVECVIKILVTVKKRRHRSNSLLSPPGSHFKHYP